MNDQDLTYTAFHLCAGIGGGALGFQASQEEWRGIRGNFRNLGGVDSDPLCVQDFGNLVGVPASQIDLFSEEDYIAFHGRRPPQSWRECTPDDLRKAAQYQAPDVTFSSPPCKGFSGLLSQKNSESEKYQALNRLVIRNIILTLEAWKEDPPAIIMIENVPMIRHRGKDLLNQIKGVLASYGYVWNDVLRNLGHVGGMGQNRNRWLGWGRYTKKLSNFVFDPPQRRLKTIGDVIGPLPMPDTPAAGPLHRLPRLQWKTWVRLALIPAGGDWRNLQTLDGAYRITPESNGEYTSKYRVERWEAPAHTVTGSDRLGSGAPSVADVRLGHKPRKGVFQVALWDEPSNAVIGSASVRGSNGVAAVADPRFPEKAGRHKSHYRVGAWDEVAGTVTGADHLANGAPAVADPRLTCSPRNGTMGVSAWDEPAAAVIGSADTWNGGAGAVADPRIPGDKEQGVWVIVALDGTWHRPLTTYELAALQDLPLVMPDGRPLTLAGHSDRRWREAIGNMVPPSAAQAYAETILRSMLPASQGIWALGSTSILVNDRHRDVAGD